MIDADAGVEIGAYYPGQQHLSGLRQQGGIHHVLHHRGVCVTTGYMIQRDQVMRLAATESCFQAQDRAIGGVDAGQTSQRLTE